MEVFGRGHLSTKAGAAVYITKCNPVSVQPRAVVNCTSEIPVMYNGTAMFVDPISYILRTHAVPIKCTDVAPPRFNPLTQSVRIRTVFYVTLKARISVIFRDNLFLFFSFERGYI
jgi:hypothetical protein